MALFQTYAKFVVAGEHAVLRGGSALAFPLRDLTFNLYFIKGSEKLTTQNIEYQHHDLGDHFLQFEGQKVKICPTKTSQRPCVPKPLAKEASRVFYQVLQHTLKLVGRSPSDLKGRFKIENQIPVGCGLGASAACSLALAYLCQAQGWVSQVKLFELARQIENFFHTQSSGFDVATIRSQTPVLYNKGAQPIQPAWWPRFRLSYSGRSCRTDKSIQKVHSWQQKHPQQVKQVDQHMNAATQLALQALKNSQPQQACKQLAEALCQAGECFKTWGLVTPELQKHMDQLLSEGALAAKPTGSGGGGYILSLWP